MAKQVSFGKLDLKIVSSMEDVRAKAGAELPFRIAVLGDFSGRGNRGKTDPAALAHRKPLLVDRDTIDEIMQKLDVALDLPILGGKSAPVPVRFSGLGDFHPDRLFERCDVFQSLRDTRAVLTDPSALATLAQASKTGHKPAQPTVARKEAREVPGRASREAPGGLLDRVLDETEGKEPRPASRREASEWDTFLHEVVSPHAVTDVGKKFSEMLSSVDAVGSALLRRMLHHPHFQEMEAAWRALYFMLSRLEESPELKLYLCDITRDELTTDIMAQEDLRSTGIFRLLVEQTVETFGGEPWAVVAGNYTFDLTGEDAAVLGRMAKIARQAGAPFIAAASPQLVGCESLAKTPEPAHWKVKSDPDAVKAWSALRRLPEASYIGLVLPRFLLRLPYGAHTEPIESFGFEEMEGTPEHEQYLWGNPSFACVYLLAQTFSHHGWAMEPGMMQDIGDLPLHVYKEHGEAQSKPCGEVLLTQHAAEALLDHGLMPLVSFKEQDVIRLVRFQSIGDPPTRLSGPWVTELPPGEP